MFNRYYEDELAFLREMGAEFARANPAAAPFLAERGADPDVERLLEGFAFLAGRIRQKLDDDFPELTQALMELLWPHVLRPLPGFTIMQFEPLPQMVRRATVVPRGAEVAASAIEGTVCPFRTTAPARLLPLSLEDAVVERPAGSAGRLRLALRPSPGAKPEEIELSPLRLHLHGDPATAYALYLALTRRLKGGALRAGSKVVEVAPRGAPGGFGEDEALLPFPATSFPGFRTLTEYFAAPQKFLFVDIVTLPRLPALGDVAAGEFELLLEFSETPEGALRAGPENVRLHCAPAVNLFAADSEPLRVDHEKVAYRLRPAGVDPLHGEVFSVDAVEGWVRGSAAARPYRAFQSFAHVVERAGEGGTVYYQVERRASPLDERVDTLLSFVSGDAAPAPPPSETVVAKLTCTNRGLPARLRVGDVSRATDGSPTCARFRNIAPVTPGYPPPLGGELHWRLLSHLALSHRSLGEIDVLRGLLAVYDLPALFDRQAARRLALRLEGLRSARIVAEETLLRGAPLRGSRLELLVDESGFAGDGEMLLFGAALDEFLSEYAALNSYCRLALRGAKQGETFSWPPRLGRRPLA